MYSQKIHYLIECKAPCNQKLATKSRVLSWCKGGKQNDFSAYAGSQHPPKKWKVNNWPVASARQKARVCGERREQWPGGGWRRDFRWLTLSLRSLGVCCGAARILVTRATDQSDPKNHPADASYLPGHKHTHTISHLRALKLLKWVWVAAVYMPLWSRRTTNYYSSRYQNTLTSCAPLTRVAHKTKRERVRLYTKQTRWMPFISVCQIRSACLPALSLSLSVGNFAWVIIAEVRGFDHRTPAHLLNWSFLPLIRLQLLCSACPFHVLGKQSLFVYWRASVLRKK
jgi:hypothetical protein